MDLVQVTTQRKWSDMENNQDLTCRYLVKSSQFLLSDIQNNQDLIHRLLVQVTTHCMWSDMENNQDLTYYLNLV